MIVGVFGNLDFQATELTSKDNYQVAFNSSSSFLFSIFMHIFYYHF